MAVPSAMSDLFLAAASNSPGGSEAVGTNLDDYLRALASIIRSQYSLASSPVASAATTVVSTSDGESIAITGTTTIASLGTGYAGCVRELRFSTVLTLTNSANLWLGGNNITTQSGDVLRFRCISAGVWYLIAASRSGVSNNVTALAINAGAVAVNCAAGDYFTLAATANMTSFALANPPGAGKAQTVRIRIQQDGTGSRIATWPSSFKWAGGVAGVLSTGINAVDLLELKTFDQGTTWLASLTKAHA